jgi:hypothetical protein
MQDTSLRFRFQSDYIGFYRYLVIRKVVMCQYGTSDESFQNHHYLAGTRITVKLALPADPLGQIVELAMNGLQKYLFLSFSCLCNCYAVG